MKTDSVAAGASPAKWRSCSGLYNEQRLPPSSFLNSAALHATARARRRVHSSTALPTYNTGMPIPPEIAGQKYISLASFRKSGDAVRTPVWFGEKDDKLYVMTRSDSGKYKRIRNNPKVRIAPCTMRGKITGPEFAQPLVFFLPSDWPWAAKNN